MTPSPLLRKYGSTLCVMRICITKLIATSLSISSVVISKNGPAKMMPALLNRISSRPKRLSAASKTCCGASSSPRSRASVVIPGNSPSNLWSASRSRSTASTAVLAVDRDREALHRLEGEFPGITTLALDLGDEDAPQQVFDAALNRFGRLDILFNNAGIIFAGPFLEMTTEDIERLVAINFVMQIRMTHNVLPYFLKRGEGVIA